MSEFAKFLKILGIIAGVVLVGIAVGYLGTRGSQGSPPSAPVASPGQSPAGSSAPARSNNSPSTAERQGTRPTELPNQMSGAEIPVAPENVITNWEDRLDEILTSDKDEQVKAKDMLQIFPRLPEDGQVEVAQHLSNLVSDENYAPLSQYLTNTALPEAVLDVLLSDLLNRPNSLKLPSLVGVARDPQNPKASEAKDLLELYLEEDYGNDWATWQTKVDQWLKDNPD